MNILQPLSSIEPALFGPEPIHQLLERRGVLRGQWHAFEVFVTDHVNGLALGK
jgi:hypothetical protein